MTVGDGLVLATLLVLAWQTWLLRKEMHDSGVRDMYSKWQEINKLEIEHPALHRMFMGKELLDKCDGLTTEQLKERAQCLLILDMFSNIYFSSRKRTVYSRLDVLIRSVFEKRRRWQRLCAFMLRKWRGYYSAHRTLFELNEAYIAEVMNNPAMRRGWIDYGLGDTWKGLGFYDFVNSVLEPSQEDQVPRGEEATTAERGSVGQSMPKRASKSTRPL